MSPPKALLRGAAALTSTRHRTTCLWWALRRATFTSAHRPTTLSTFRHTQVQTGADKSMLFKEFQTYTDTFASSQASQCTEKFGPAGSEVLTGLECRRSQGKHEYGQNSAEKHTSVSTFGRMQVWTHRACKHVPLDCDMLGHKHYNVQAFKHI